MIDPNKMVMVKPEVLAADPIRLAHYKGQAGRVKNLDEDYYMIFWPSLQHSSVWAGDQLYNIPKE